jgi:predicted Rossmann fold flavoprotein
MKQYDILIIGGGAAGFFAAINSAERNPKLKIAILERGKEVLSKVRVSGGGRCNVTHNCFDVAQLVKFYPRGEKELRGPFSVFSPKDTIAWFEKHNVKLKTEEDNRMFPVTDSSQTIIDCFLEAAQKLKIDILTSQSVQSVFKSDDFWKVETQSEKYTCQNLIFTTGSNPKMWELLSSLGHQIISPVPSLFTFNIKDNRIKDLMGLSTPATVKINQSKLQESGALLITHWGLSGPAVLKLSAWGARELFDKNYQFQISVNWLDYLSFEQCIEELKNVKSSESKKLVRNRKAFDIPTRLWENLVSASEIPDDLKWADVSKKQLNNLADQLTNSQFQVNGKSTFKEEFVTAGGVNLKEVNFKTMESKQHKNLYFAGEILNIDAITGGFNFQNAWAGGYIVAQNFANI